jgi:hypothetical protein
MAKPNALMAHVANAVMPIAVTLSSTINAYWRL